MDDDSFLVRLTRKGVKEKEQTYKGREDLQQEITALERKIDRLKTKENLDSLIGTQHKDGSNMVGYMELVGGEIHFYLNSEVVEDKSTRIGRRLFWVRDRDVDALHEDFIAPLWG